MNNFENMDDSLTAVDIRQRIDGIGELVTLRQLRDFINQLPVAALDSTIVLAVDGGYAETTTADFRNGVLNLS